MQFFFNKRFFWFEKPACRLADKIKETCLLSFTQVDKSCYISRRINNFERHYQDRSCALE